MKSSIIELQQAASISEQFYRFMAKGEYDKASTLLSFACFLGINCKSFSTDFLRFFLILNGQKMTSDGSLSVPLNCLKSNSSANGGGE